MTTEIIFCTRDTLRASRGENAETFQCNGDTRYHVWRGGDLLFRKITPGAPARCWVVNCNNANGPYVTVHKLGEDSCHVVMGTGSKHIWIDYDEAIVVSEMQE